MKEVELIRDAQLAENPVTLLTCQDKHLLGKVQR